MNVNQISSILSFSFQRSTWGLFAMTVKSWTFTLNMNTQREELRDRAIVKIAAHLPDLIVYGDFSPKRPSVDDFDGVLMFVDISGKHKGMFNVGEQQAHSHWNSHRGPECRVQVQFLSFCAVTTDSLTEKTRGRRNNTLSSSLTKFVQSWAIFKMPKTHT